jgi:hypothetical protein
VDFADAASDAETYHLELALRQQANRASITPLPLCEECREKYVHVTALGTRFRYCDGCTYDLTGRKV